MPESVRLFSACRSLLARTVFGSRKQTVLDYLSYCEQHNRNREQCEIAFERFASGKPDDQKCNRNKQDKIAKGKQQ